MVAIVGLGGHIFRERKDQGDICFVTNLIRDVLSPNTHQTKYPSNQIPIKPNTHQTKYPSNQVPIKPNTHQTKYPSNQGYLSSLTVHLLVLSHDAKYRQVFPLATKGNPPENCLSNFENISSYEYFYHVKILFWAYFLKNSENLYKYQPRMKCWKWNVWAS